MTPPLISVIIPTYNRGQFVTCAIDSVLAQTSYDCEIIVIDDGSTDDTRQVLSKYESSITYRYQKNSGVSEARNAGIRLAKGEWVSFLDSDDEWLPNFLSVQVGAIASCPRAVGSIMNVLNVRQDDSAGTIFEDRGFISTLRGQRSMVKERALLDIVEHKLTPIMIGALFRRNVILKTGGFDTKLRIAEDLDFVGKMALQGALIFGVEPVAKLLRRKESTCNLTSQLYESGIYTWECLHKVYERFATDASLTHDERMRLDDIISENLRSLGNLYFRAGNKEKARAAYKKSALTSLNCRSLLRYFTSFMPTSVVLRTIQKSMEIQPGKLPS